LKWRSSKAGVKGRRVGLSGRLALLSLGLILAAGGVAWVGFGGESAPPPDPSAAAAAPILLLQPPAETAAPTVPPTTDVPPSAPQAAEPALLFFALRSGGSSHLWGQAAGSTQRYALTSGEWDDRDPAVSPDGSRLAFASNRGGSWDLYLMDLASGDTRQLTDTAGYEGRPTWSPDGLWLAYEAYYGEDLDIWVLPVDGSQPAIQLTDDPASDLAPSWDPNGRRIAFISDRTGLPDLYLADLDKPVDRFTNLSQTPNLAEADPAFDPSGRRIAYSAWQDGLEQLWMVEASQGAPAAWLGQGGRPSWMPDGSTLTALLTAPTRAQLVAYGLTPDAAPPGMSTAGQLEGMSWTRSASIPAWATLVEADSGLTVGEASPTEPRLGLVALPGVSPEGMALSQSVVEAFMGLRERAGAELGWDFLGQLDMAFVDLNDRLPPGFPYNDWLHTGRAFAFSQAAHQAGWVEVLRRDFGSLTYWQVFVRTAAQDGSLGEPLRAQPWDFDARYSGDPSLYDQGGRTKPTVPPGYYVDFTALAAGYGFQRLPALNNWRTYYPAARFSEFVLTGGLDWMQAMLQLYPPEAIATPTPFQTPTQTPTNTPRPTPTPWWWRWRTPTPPPSTPTPGAP
jgi:TolB protein